MKNTDKANERLKDNKWNWIVKSVTRNRKNTGKIQSSITYHIITWQELLKKLSLFVLNCFDDELVITSYKK